MAKYNKTIEGISYYFPLWTPDEIVKIFKENKNECEILQNISVQFSFPKPCSLNILFFSTWLINLSLWKEKVCHKNSSLLQFILISFSSKYHALVWCLCNAYLWNGYILDKRNVKKKKYLDFFRKHYFAFQEQRILKKWLLFSRSIMK